MSQESKRIRIIIWLASACAVILLISAWTLSAQQKAAKEKQAQLEADYATALDCLAQNAYNEALAYFAGTVGHQDADMLIQYAKAASLYNPNDGTTYRSAYQYLVVIPDAYSGPFAEQISSMRRDLTTRKTRYDAEQALIAAEEEKQREQQFRANLKQQLPYVGMSEAYISQTILGKAGEVSQYNKTVDGEKRYCTDYTWYVDNGKWLLFTAWVYNGAVIKVHKFNDGVYWDGNTILGTVGGAHSNYSYSKPSRTPDPDPYNASDYSHPEDFYYDYYDDFWDYEDAEDYWDEHS